MRLGKEAHMVLSAVMLGVLRSGPIHYYYYYVGERDVTPMVYRLVHRGLLARDGVRSRVTLTKLGYDSL